MTKKKIAFVVDSLELVFPEGPLKGGGNLVARHLIYEFARKENVELYVISGQCNPLEIEGVKEVIMLHYSPFVFNCGFLSELKNYMQGKFDYVLTLNHEVPYGNVLVQAHTSEYRCTNTKNVFTSWILKNFYAKDKIAYSKSRFTEENKDIYVVSNRLKFDLIKNTNIKNEQITVSYPGVEINELKYKQQNDIFTFGMTAATSLNKGSKDLLIALVILKLLHVNFKINLILSTPKKNRFVLGFIKIFGLKKYVNIWERQTDMSDFYCACDCILFPSLNETFGLVPLEAASYKVPSIISSTTGAAEIFTNNLNSIIYTKERFPILHLTKAMFNMIKMHKENKIKYDKLSNNAFEIAKKYNWQQFADKIYHKIMED